MEKKNSFFIISILVLLSLFFFACEEEPETFSVQERVDAFLSDLNIDSRTSIYEHLHSSIAGAWQSSVSWDGYFSADNITFTYNIANYAANSTTGTIYNSYDLLGSSLLITLEEDETDNWKITLIKVDIDIVIY